MTRWSIDNALLTWGEDGLPRSEYFGDVYFSRHDPMAETAHVFLDGNRLQTRFREPPPRFVIAELGFGTGLNFLSAWRLWDEVAPRGSHLHFISCEQYPLTREDLVRCHALWPALRPWAEALQSAYPQRGAGQHRIQLRGTAGDVTLDLLYGDALSMMNDLAVRAVHCVDAWFLDGFAPRCNERMWLPDLFRNMALLSRSGCTLATYSVAAGVRQGLQEAGFTVRKTPGYGHKRHMLQGELAAPTTAGVTAHRAVSSVTIIGAGLAGSACAHALARRGLAVTVLDQAAEPASAASGNPQGALFMPLHRDANPRAALLSRAAGFAARYYDQLQADGHELEWHACGALQLHERNGPGFFDRVCKNTLYDTDIVTRVTSAEASALAGIPLQHEALSLAGSGWLNPAALCRARLSVPGISLHCSQQVVSLTQVDGQWQTLDGQGNRLSSSDALIIANASDAPALLPGHDYPLFPNRGQLSYLRASRQSQQLRRVLCGKGYLLPARDGTHVLGSSFEPRSTDIHERDSDHQHNLALLGELVPALADAFNAGDILGGRASLRCTTGDYLPLTGPVEDRAAEPVRSRDDQPRQWPAVPGLYLCSGFGSHGITMTPLLAEHLACLITGEIGPLDRSSARLVEPERFLRRGLKSR